MAEKRRLAR